MKKAKFSKSGHVLAAAGAAVGIANLVIFPERVIQLGGGAFVLCFLLSTMIMGLPLMVAETALGKHAQSDAVKAFKDLGGNTYGWIGWFGILTCCLILSFYAVIAGWALAYLMDISTGAFLMQEIDTGMVFGNLVTDEKRVMLYVGIALAFTVIVVGAGVKKGIENISKTFMPLLFILIISLIIYRLSLNGTEGLERMWKLDFARLLNSNENGPRGLVIAIGQAFFSLSLGACAMITYGTHMKKESNVLTSSRMIVGVDTIMALLGAVLICLFLAGVDEKGLPSGPPLVFISLTKIFSDLGEVGTYAGVAFFALFNMAILTSTISLLEPIVNYLSKDNSKLRMMFSVILGLVIFMISIPSIVSFDAASYPFWGQFLGLGSASEGGGFFNFMLEFFGTICLIIGSLLLVLFVQRKWSIIKLLRMLDSPEYRPPGYLTQLVAVSLRWITPILLALVLFGELIKLIT